MLADDNFRFDENGRKLSKRVENTVGKGEIARYEQFLLFLQCFQKACFPGTSKGVIVWEWGKSSSNTVKLKRGVTKQDLNTAGDYQSMQYNVTVGFVLEKALYQTTKKKVELSKSNVVAKDNLILSQTSLGFYVSAVQVFWKHCGKRRNCS